MEDQDTKSTPESEKTELQTPNIAEALDKKEKGAGEEKVGGEEAPEKKEDKFTQADVDKALEVERKRYSGLDSKLTKLQQTSKDEVGRLEKALEEQQLRTEEARDLTFLKKVEEDGGDVDATKLMLAREKTSRALERDLAGRKRTLDEQETILAEAGKAKKATDLIKEHELEADVVDELLGCETPAEMEVKALKLRIEKGAVDAKTVAKTDSQDKGTKTSTEGMSIEERMGQSMEGNI